MHLGGVAEWSIASVLKTEEAQASVGSNPTPSANFAAGKEDTSLWDENLFEPRAARQAKPIPPSLILSQAKLETFRWSDNVMG